MIGLTLPLAFEENLIKPLRVIEDVKPQTEPGLADSNDNINVEIGDEIDEEV